DEPDDELVVIRNVLTLVLRVLLERDRLRRLIGGDDERTARDEERLVRREGGHVVPGVPEVRRGLESRVSLDRSSRVALRHVVEGLNELLKRNARLLSHHMRGL